MEYKDECNTAIAESVNNNMYIDECHAAVKSLVAPIEGVRSRGVVKVGEEVKKGTEREMRAAKRTGKGVSRPSLSFLG